MECFRYGFDFPEIQGRAAMLARTVAVTIPPRRRTRHRYVRKPRRQYTPTVPIPFKKPVRVKPPTFTIELYNLFEILDI
jgi:hypothetical protein